MDIKFEDIAKANETIKTTDIKGKQYAEVPQRIKAFRMLYPNGFIHTSIVSNENGVCVMRAEAGYFENGEKVVLGTGTAFESKDSTFINKTSYIENCETSCVGRALGMCGFGIETSVASAEEVTNAINNQEKKPTTKKEQPKDEPVEFHLSDGKNITPQQKENISREMTRVSTDFPDKFNREFFLEAYKVSSVDELLEKDYEQIMSQFAKYKKE